MTANIQGEWRYLSLERRASAFGENHPLAHGCGPSDSIDIVAAAANLGTHQPMPQNPDVRWRQRLQSFRKAFAQLSSAATLAKSRNLSDLERQGLIQAFEFTHELAWNTLKDFLESRGAVKLYGSRDATREAFAKGLIANGEEWMAMIQSRNRSSHTYNENTAKEVAAAILSGFVPEFTKFLTDLTNLEISEP